MFNPCVILRVLGNRRYFIGREDGAILEVVIFSDEVQRLFDCAVDTGNERMRLVFVPNCPELTMLIPSRQDAGLTETICLQKYRSPDGECVRAGFGLHSKTWLVRENALA